MGLRMIKALALALVAAWLVVLPFAADAGGTGPRKGGGGCCRGPFDPVDPFRKPKPSVLFGGHPIEMSSQAHEFANWLIEGIATRVRDERIKYFEYCKTACTADEQRRAVERIINELSPDHKLFLTRLSVDDQVGIRDAIIAAGHDPSRPINQLEWWQKGLQFAQKSTLAIARTEIENTKTTDAVHRLSNVVRVLYGARAAGYASFFSDEMAASALRVLERGIRKVMPDDEYLLLSTPQPVYDFQYSYRHQFGPPSQRDVILWAPNCSPDVRSNQTYHQNEISPPIVLIGSFANGEFNVRTAASPQKEFELLADGKATVKLYKRCGREETYFAIQTVKLARPSLVKACNDSTNTSSRHEAREPTAICSQRSGFATKVSASPIGTPPN